MKDLERVEREHVSMWTEYNVGACEILYFGTETNQKQTILNAWDCKAETENNPGVQKHNLQVGTTSMKEN